MNIAITVTPTTKTGYALHNLATHAEFAAGKIGVGVPAAVSLNRAVLDATTAAMERVRLTERDILDYNYVVSFEEQPS